MGLIVAAEYIQTTNNYRNIFEIFTTTKPDSSLNAFSISMEIGVLARSVSSSASCVSVAADVAFGVAESAGAEVSERNSNLIK